MVRLSFLQLCHARNFPKKFIEKEKGFREVPGYKHKWYRNTEHGPWSLEEKGENARANQRKKPFPLLHAPLREWEIFKGDLVCRRQSVSLKTGATAASDQIWPYHTGRHVLREFCFAERFVCDFRYKYGSAKIKVDRAKWSRL